MRVSRLTSMKYYEVSESKPREIYATAMKAEGRAGETHAEQICAERLKNRIHSRPERF